MPYVIYFLLLYAFMLTLIYVGYRLISLYIIKYAAVQKARVTSLTHPIVKAFTILIVALLARNGVSQLIIPLLTNFFQQYLGIDIGIAGDTDTIISSIETITFYLVVGVISVTYAIIAFRQQQHLMDNSVPFEPEPAKIHFPDPPPPPSPLFHERDNIEQVAHYGMKRHAREAKFVRLIKDCCQDF